MFDKFDDRTKEWFFPNGQLEELKSLFEPLGEEVIEEAIIERLSVTLKNSRAFDTNLFAEGAGVLEAIEYLKKRFSNIGYNFHKSVNAPLSCILANLYRKHLRNKRQWTGIRLHRGKGIPKIYNPSGINPKSTERIKNALLQLELIYFVPGFKAKIAKRSRSPKIIADDSLIELLEMQFGWNPLHIKYHSKANTIEMKSKKDKAGNRKLIEVKLTKELTIQRDTIIGYNKLLSNQLILLPSDDGFYPDLIHAKRVFNNNDWKSGGRVFGGEFQQLSEPLRQQITINGENVIELDIKSCHATMAFAHIGIDWYAESSEDLYLREELTNWPRDVIKVAFNTMLNADSSKSAIASLNYRQGNSFFLEDNSIFPFNGWASKLVQDILDAFPELNKVFFSGLGNIFMNKEGNICLEIIKHSLETGIPILTLHDSFICPESYRDKLRFLIIEEFKKEVGATCAVI